MKTMKTVGRILLKTFGMIFAGIFAAIMYALAFVAYIVSAIAGVFGLLAGIIDEGTLKNAHEVFDDFNRSLGYVPVETDE